MKDAFLHHGLRDHPLFPTPMPQLYPGLYFFFCPSSPLVLGNSRLRSMVILATPSRCRLLNRFIICVTLGHFQTQVSTRDTRSAGLHARFSIFFLGVTPGSSWDRNVLGNLSFGGDVVRDNSKRPGIMHTLKNGEIFRKG